MPEKTPGEIAYLAYRQQMARPRLVHWPGLTAQEQASWEAAAQAVLDAALARPTQEPVHVTAAVAAAQAVLAWQKEEETRGSPGNSPHALS